MPVGHLHRAARASRGVAAFQLMRVLIVTGFAAAGALVVSQYVEDQDIAQEVVAAAGPHDGAKAHSAPGQTTRTIPTRVASADGSAADALDASGVHPVAVDEPLQEAAPAGTIAAASPDPVVARDAATKDETRSPATEQAGAEEPSPPDVPEKTGAVTVASIATEAPQASDLVDLNTASFAQLNTLRNASLLARAIIKARPYASVEDLVKRKVVRRSVYEKIKDQITVR